MNNNILTKLKRHIKRNIMTNDVSNSDKIDESAYSKKDDWVDESKMSITETDSNKVWAFCSGHYSNDFRGNPKWLFIYINEYRKDISAYWICENVEVIEQVRAMGYQAYRLGTIQAEEAINRTGVLVAEQVKMVLPAGMEQVKYLNLWHGVGGIKDVERSLTTGVLAEQIAKKYIQKNDYYHTHQLYLAPSAFIEKIAMDQLGLSQDKIIRAGYPRCLYQKYYKKIASYDHDLVKQRGLPEDTRIAAYTPTFRNHPEGELFTKAIPDMEQLIKVCEKEHILMIFKMHPFLEEEIGFLRAKETYGDCPWLFFWDNKDDFYEILDRIDLCIMDYSSIFTDLLAAGVHHFLRYAFDFNEDDLSFPMGYDEVTPGRKCTTFTELLNALAHYEEDDIKEDLDRIRALYWEYSDKDSMERIIEHTLFFEPEEMSSPNLYSFDIFDTLISRKVLNPIGIFYYIREKMVKSNLSYPEYLIENYPQIRKNAELNMREYYNRSKLERDDERCEIQFHQILERIQTLYNLTEEQVRFLGEWEMEAELENVIPLPERINRVKELVAQGEMVVLISDMYLPKEFIKKMLYKAEPMLAELPLFLSSELGYQKSAKTLYLEVYRSFAPNYNFGKWIHTGDNRHSDKNMAERLNIKAIKVEALEFSEFEKSLVAKLDSYDGYLIAASMARFRETHSIKKEEFVYSYISLLFVPYVRWALHDAIKRGDQIVYFVSRDGHQLKRIADVIVKEEQLPIETKYLYASRRAWRIPSFYDSIDVGFWGQGYGNLAKVSSLRKLLKALDMDEATFRQMFPELSDITEETEIDHSTIVKLTKIFKNSAKYKDYLLSQAAIERVATCGYLEQEIDRTKQFSIVEYWGRGYTQENFTRLWQDIVGEKVPVTFYYSRSTLPSDQYNIRRNYTSNTSSQSFIESIFACINYKSIEEYENVEGRWVPVITPLDCDMELFNSMESYLPLFAEHFCNLPLLDRDKAGHALIDFAISYYTENQNWNYFTEILAKLVDSVELYGAKSEYAKALTEGDLDEMAEGKPRGQISKSITMSVARASKPVQTRYMEMFQIRPGESMNNGRLISDTDLEMSRKYQHRLETLQKNVFTMNEFYSEAVRCMAIQEKILVITDGKSFGTEYNSLFKALAAQSEFQVTKLALKDSSINLRELAEKFASARYILATHPIKQLSGITLRKGTKLVMLGESAVQYFTKGKAKKYAIRSEQDLSNLLLDADIGIIQVPSEAMLSTYKKVYNIDGLTEFAVNGCIQTDIYYNQQLKKQMREKLNTLFPEAVDKKVICYIPYHRYRNKKSGYAQLLDMELLKRKLGNDYVVIMHKQAKYNDGIVNTGEVQGFSKDLTQKMGLRNQMLVADIIVGDYRDAVFETPLLGVPIFMSAWDADTMDRTKHTFCNYNDLTFGVPLRDTKDFINQLSHIKEYDATNALRFKQKYLTYCDGKSAERLVEYLLEDAKKLK